MVIGKVLLNLETKLTRLEATNEKLIEAYDQSNDTEAVKHFQQVLDEDSELTDNIIDKISQLKVLKEEAEKKRREIEASQSLSLEQRVTQVQEQVRQLQSGTPSTGIANIWSQPNLGPMKPPQLDIRAFNGDVLKWQEFWDAFEASVHRANYASIDKFNYLKSKLEGEALEAISGYQLSNENYDVVVDILKRRFGNKQLIIDAHYRSLSHLPAATNQVAKLRSCYDSIERHLRSLDAIGENVNHRHFIALIFEKLPQKVHCQLYMQKPEGEEWTVTTLCQLLGKYILAMEMAGNESSDVSTPAVNPNPSHTNQRNRPPHFRSTTGGLVAGNNSRGSISPRQFQPKCVYCDQFHWSDQCPTYSTLQERKEKLRGSCYNCLQRGHTLKECTKDRKCAHCGRSKSHHRSLCNQLFQQTTELQNINNVDKAEGTTVACANQVVMQTATTTVKNPQDDSSVSVRLILDSGSQRSYITEKLAKGLNLSLNQTERLSVVTFGSDKPKRIECKSSELSLLLKDGSVLSLRVTVVPNITGKINRVPLKLGDIEFINKEFSEHKLADSLPCQAESSTIEMLIGNDYYFELLQPRKIDFGEGLFLFYSKLGWILSGQVHCNAEENNEPSLLVSTIGSVPRGLNVNTYMLTNIDLSLESKPNLEHFWSLESIGINESPLTVDDDQAIDSFNKTIKFVDGRYLVTWPWKEPNPDLPDNYNLAVGRLKSTVQRLRKNPRLLKMYTDVIQDQLDRGIIERVPSDTKEGPVKHYIPHHAAITPSKATTKVRVVYDASAKSSQSNKSLNECLYRGPVILPDLFGLLIRFRLLPIAIVADVEKAFLNVGLQVPDRDATRFLWLKEPKNPQISGNLQVFRFCRIPFGIISSPFLLEATIMYHLKQAGTLTAERLQRDIYVDNLVTGVRNLQEAKDLYTESKTLFSSVSMNLREWGSNSKEFTDFIAEEDRTPTCIGKVLGIIWNHDNDTLAVPGLSHVKLEATSKLKVLQIIGSVFDLLGYYSPTILKAKLFMKMLWKEKCEWDTKLDTQKLTRWEEIMENLKDIPNYTIPRYLGFLNEDQCFADLTLICFCDASVKAYATTVYLYRSSLGNYKTDLIFSKNRLAPEQITIPRLELLGVLIGVRALKFVQKELCLPVISKVLYTDSQCVLHWMQTAKPLPVFITNRLKEIKTDQGIYFKYVPTKDNPVGIATRGLSPSELSLSIWWTGPQWLQQHKKHWPEWRIPETNRSSQQLDTESEKMTSSELKLIVGEGSHMEKRESTLATVTVSLVDIKEERFSTLLKLLRVTAWVIRFTNRLRRRDTEKGTLTAEEIQVAKQLWDVYIQNKHYLDVISDIKKGKRNNLVSQLNLQLDKQHILRCHGRYENTDLNLETRYPKLLPKEEHFTDLVIKDCHKRMFHAGVSQTLAQTRVEYWIPQGRLQVKRVLKQCMICQQVEGGAFKMPRMPPWPRERVTEALPFEYTGLDYFGPLHVKCYDHNLEQTNGECVYKKVWVCLFTCMVTKAKHLEIINDMSADQFLLCLRRFVARQGIPRQILSDNAKQFKLAKRVLAKAQQEMITNDDVDDYLSKQGIQWKLIVELAPWMGSFYERLIGLTKRALRKTIGRKCLTESQLTTILIEVEAIVNSRPLVLCGR